jgi:hypothetical protein
MLRARILGALSLTGHPRFVCAVGAIFSARTQHDDMHCRVAITEAGVAGGRRHHGPGRKGSALPGIFNSGATRVAGVTLRHPRHSRADNGATLVGSVGTSAGPCSLAHGRVVAVKASLFKGQR